jgi:hypothetical protein
MMLCIDMGTKHCADPQTAATTEQTATRVHHALEYHQKAPRRHLLSESFVCSTNAATSQRGLLRTPSQSEPVLLQSATAMQSGADQH